MDQRTKIFLVNKVRIFGTRHLRLKWLLIGLILTACQPLPDADQTVNAAHYQQFWIWGRVNPAPYLPHAKELYILQGEIGFSRSQQQLVFSPQGMGFISLVPAKVWLVYRTTTLQWTPELMQALVRRLDSWQNYGNQVAGLQIDFDSATGHIKSYTEFLQRIRQQLPARYQLSITGLMDWVNADQGSLALLQQVVDEVVIQTYQGTQTIVHYQAYLPALVHLKMPFKIGLVQHGQWLAKPNFEKNPYFKGYVVFLLRQ
ncbi:MAG: DUF3142 domain-containing protein [Moraxellaceae bacterium]|nr:MAG: DUF3142 domain-containing protein [Moraxellaceae bacterium]